MCERMWGESAFWQNNEKKVVDYYLAKRCLARNSFDENKWKTINIYFP